MDEEVVLLEEQIAALQADVESLQGRLADAETLAAGREAELTRTKQQLADHQAAAASYVSETDRLRGEIDAAEERGRTAAGRYRELLLLREPELPEDLVAGTTVEEIDAAAGRARQTVSQVRQRFEAQAQATRVPAGAPARGATDTSALTPAEKIRLGLRQG
jgi:chromosome segregation ATPase